MQLHLLRHAARPPHHAPFLLVSLLFLATSVDAEVVVYPAPASETLSTDYEVWADGKHIAVYLARTLDPPFAGQEWDYGGPYSFASFDMTGNVEVRITSQRTLRDTVVLPASAHITPKIDDDHTVSFCLDRPRKLSIEPDGRKGPLLLFANPPEAKPPLPGVKNLIYFGPGSHKPGRIELQSGQTLYLAGGSVVKGGILARGDDISIRGRGILDGSDWEWRKGPTNKTIDIHGSNITVDGITIRGSSHWTIVPQHSRNVTIRNVKICNGRVQNDDGINPCNSQDVLVTDCFIRSDDDCVALKGLDFTGENNNVERVTVENCVLWCDRARIFLLGHESRAQHMRDITLRDLDIIHFAMTPFLFEPGEDMRLEHVTVQNVSIRGDAQYELVRLRPVVNQYMLKKVPGFVSHVRFKNIRLSGSPGEYLVQLSGADEMHRVTAVTFENVVVLDQPLKAESSNVQLGEYAHDVTFFTTERP